MNIAFFVGLGVAVIGELVRALPNVISGRYEHRVGWNAFSALPSFMVFCFLGGFVGDWIFSQQNQTSKFLIVLGVYFVTKLGEYILDSNASFLRNPWEHGDDQACAKVAKYIYTVTSAMAFIPYVLFADLVGYPWWIPWGLSFVLIFAILGGFDALWTYILKSEKTAAKEVMAQILRAFCERQLLTVNQQNDPTMLQHAEREDVEAALRIMNRTIQTVDAFRPIHEGRRIPGLGAFRLCDRRIAELAIEAQKELMRDLTLRRAILQILVGDENECIDAIDVASKSLTDEQLHALKSRRI